MFITKGHSLTAG